MGISACTEFQRQQKFHQSHQLHAHKQMLREIQIPPRKLHRRQLGAAQTTLYHDGVGGGGGATCMFMDPFKSGQSSLPQKSLLYNDAEEEDLFTSDNFRMYEFKIRMCPQGGSHDWSSCPFAHPGEKARRRDLQKYRYSGTVCSEFRKGYCSRGENCGFAHGIFESWLHPSRYRTEACKDGRYCSRKVCFFAHTPSEMRLFPEECSYPMNTPATHVNNCCGCNCHSNNVIMASHNSTLMDISPEKEREFPIPSRYESFEYSNAPAEPVNSSGTSYADNMTELLNSLEAINVNEASSSARKGKAPMIEPDLKWISDLVNSVIERD